MAAPSESITHGVAPSLVGISDEPASSSTVKVTKISKKFSHEDTETRNTSGAVVYAVSHSFKLDIDFEGQLALASGLGDAAPGSAVATLASFAATDRTFDPAAGFMILGNIEDSTENFNRAPMTKFTVSHFPNGVTA